MDATVRIDADEVFPPNLPNIAPHEWDDGHEVGAMSFDSVHVSGPGEAETNGDEIAGARTMCALCGERLNEDGQSVESTRGDCAESEDNQHDPDPIPVSWLNSAGIDVDTDDDSVMVRISVGDPRGAFVMRVEHMRYTDDDGNDRDELRLSVPTDQDGMPHMQLEPLASPGYYRIKD